MADRLLWLLQESIFTAYIFVEYRGDVTLAGCRRTPIYPIRNNLTPLDAFCLDARTDNKLFQNCFFFFCYFIPLNQRGRKRQFVNQTTTFV